MSSEKLILSLGSNIGDRILMLSKAVNELKNRNIIKIDKVSSFYESEPLGYANQSDFINIAVSGYSKSNPKDILVQLKKLEKDLGRVLRERWHEREIDIDIIFYGGLQYKDEILQIPHPRATERKFVLLPIMEIEANFLHPELKLSIKELYNLTKDSSKIIKIDNEVIR